MEAQHGNGYGLKSPLYSPWFQATTKKVRFAFPLRELASRAVVSFLVGGRTSLGSQGTDL
jgi:hypothetical protein